MSSLKMAKKKKEIILGITGSIAAYKACDIINSLRRLGFNIIPVMTKEAKNFISALTLQTLSDNKVIEDMFAPPPEDFNPLHTSLAERADLVLVAPATANIIGKIACGICNDILSCTICSTKAPVLIAPAMNDRMYNNKIISGNISRLKKLGYIFIGPVSGRLACGYRGMGHLASVDAIVHQVKKVLK